MCEVEWEWGLIKEWFDLDRGSIRSGSFAEPAEVLLGWVDLEDIRQQTVEGMEDARRRAAKFRRQAAESRRQVEEAERREARIAVEVQETEKRLEEIKQIEQQERDKLGKWLDLKGMIRIEQVRLWRVRRTLEGVTGEIGSAFKQRDKLLKQIKKAREELEGLSQKPKRDKVVRPKSGKKFRRTR